MKQPALLSALIGAVHPLSSKFSRLRLTNVTEVNP